MHGLYQKAKGVLRGGAALLLALLLCGAMPFDWANVTARAAGSETSARMLVPVGHTVGIKLFARGVLVVKLSDGGTPAKSCGLQTGDVIVKCGGVSVTSTEQFQTLLQENGGDATDLQIRRDGENMTLSVCPQQNGQGQYAIGAWIRDSMAGIGTMTYYDPASGAFGALGHGVSSARGTLLSMKEGFAYNAQVEDVKRGVSGQPGQLRGVADGEHTFGVLRKNTAQGVFGTANTFCQGEMLPLADYEDIHAGHASIRSTVSGTTPKEYSVEIVKVYPEAREDGRNFLLKVTDPQLLELTGGIVQGMSGSPILQNGKLIGAVTHVLVSDAATGYGIYIGNMLDAAA